MRLIILFFFMLPQWAYSSQEIPLEAVSKPQLFSWLSQLNFQASSTPAQISNLNRTKKIVDNFLNKRSKDLKPSEKKSLLGYSKKIGNFLKLNNTISDCGPGDRRGLKLGTMLAAGQADPCEPSIPLLNPSGSTSLDDIGKAVEASNNKSATAKSLALDLTNQAILDNMKSQLTTHFMMPFASKKTKNQICQHFQSKFHEAQNAIGKKCHQLAKEIENDKTIPKFSNIEEIKTKFEQKAQSLNKDLKAMELKISCELAVLRDQGRKGADARELLKLAKEKFNTEPAYLRYIEKYNELTQGHEGRLLMVPPLNDRFGAPVEQKNIQFSAIRSAGVKCPDGRAAVGLNMPNHFSENYAFSSTPNKINLKTPEIEKLVQHISEGHKKSIDAIAAAGKNTNTDDQLEQLVKASPFSLGKVLMRNPDYTDQACNIISAINKNDRNLDYTFTAIDTVALSIGVIPIFGWAGTTLVRGASAGARMVSLAARAASSKSMSALAIGTTGVELANAQVKIDHYNSLSESFDSIVLSGPQVNDDAREKYNKAKSELDAAIMDTYLIGGFSTLSGGVALRNILKSDGANISGVTKKVSTLTTRLRTNITSTLRRKTRTSYSSENLSTLRNQNGGILETTVPTNIAPRLREAFKSDFYSKPGVTSNMPVSYGRRVTVSVPGVTSTGDISTGSGEFADLAKPLGDYSKSVLEEVKEAFPHIADRLVITQVDVGVGFNAGRNLVHTDNAGTFLHVTGSSSGRTAYGYRGNFGQDMLNKVNEVDPGAKQVYPYLSRFEGDDAIISLEYRASAHEQVDLLDRGSRMTMEVRIPRSDVFESPTGSAVLVDGSDFRRFNSQQGQVPAGQNSGFYHSSPLRDVDAPEDDRVTVFVSIGLKE